MDKIWKAIRTLFLLSSLVSMGFMFMNRQAVMGLIGIPPGASSVSAAAGGTTGEATTEAVASDPSKLAGLISAAAPKSFKAQMAAGALFLRQEKLDQAMEAFHKALELDPANAGAHFQVGMILMKHKKSAEAETEFREAIRLDPNSIDGRFGLAAVLQQTQGLDAAGEQYREIIRLKPENAEAHNNLGIVYDAQGSKEKALAEFQRSLELDPANAVSKQNFDELTAEIKQSQLISGPPAPAPPPIEPAAQAQQTQPAEPMPGGAEPEPAPPQDALVLMNGRTVRGTITEKTDSGVWLEVASGKIFFGNNEIQEIKHA